VTSQKHGVRALGRQRVLGLGSSRTAWTWLHKLRRALVRPGRDRLSGTVEVDETHLVVRATASVGEDPLPQAHQVASLLKRGWLGTH